MTDKTKEKCKATIVFGDDYGDNDCTFHCQLEKCHDGLHIESEMLYGKRYTVCWADEDFKYVDISNLEEV